MKYLAMNEDNPARRPLSVPAERSFATTEEAK